MRHQGVVHKGRPQENGGGGFRRFVTLHVVGIVNMRTKG